jgi:hydroxymethylpyrimidine/phosphomethylpyrimidine kinase
MLARGDTVRAVVRLLSGARVQNLVVDPVAFATSGASLLDPTGIRHLRDRLVPLARLVTPNRFEASMLSAVDVDDVASATEAGRRILRLGARAVLVKGGHLDGPPIDVLVERRGVQCFTGRRIPWGAHGTGCVLSAALAARLALGDDLEGAVRRAKRFLEARLRRAVAFGTGRRQLDLRR